MPDRRDGPLWEWHRAELGVTWERQRTAARAGRLEAPRLRATCWLCEPGKLTSQKPTLLQLVLEISRFRRP